MDPCSQARGEVPEAEAAKEAELEAELEAEKEAAEKEADTEEWGSSGGCRLCSSIQCESSTASLPLSLRFRMDAGCRSA